jgi:hypothetical protein
VSEYQAPRKALLLVQRTQDSGFSAGADSEI